jgi:hypothetical protein
MMKWIAMLAVTAVLSSCGSYEFGIVADIGVGIDNSGAVATVTETTDDKGVRSLQVSDAQPVKVSFQARPGSQGAYIEGYEITSDVIDGEEVLDAPKVVQGLNIFVPSGFTCPKQDTLQSCAPTDKDSQPANGVEIDKLGIDIANSLTGLAISQRSSVSRSVNFTFYGRTANYERFEVSVTNVEGSAQYVIR